MMFDSCLFGGTFKGCILDYALFWAALSALAAVFTAFIAWKTAKLLFNQLTSLKSDSELRSAESYVNLIQTLQNTGANQTGAITQIAAVRAIKNMTFNDYASVINDLEDTLKHFENQNVSTISAKKLCHELAIAIEHLRSLRTTPTL